MTGPESSAQGNFAVLSDSQADSPPNYLAQLLAADPRREAVASMRGYDWQRWLTVEHWLGLEGEDALWIEWGEDFAIENANGVRTIQGSASLCLLLV